jgi:hypothetical protein
MSTSGCLPPAARTIATATSAAESRGVDERRIRAQLPFVAVRAGTIDDSGGSDHRPVFAELALRAGVAELRPEAAWDGRHLLEQGDPEASRVAGRLQVARRAP